MPRYALVTGASSGIGLALAEALARRGRNLILVARQRDALESIAYELAQRFGVDVLFRTCDLAQPIQLSGLLHELEQNDYLIDLLVNNAGIGQHGAFIEQDWSDAQRLIELNVLALTRLCHAIGGAMARRGQGQILNLASLAAFQPGPWLSSYCASKAYVLHFSEGLRVELASSGVGVSVLCPGPTRSAFMRKAGITFNSRAASKWVLSAEEVALVAVRGLDKNRAVIVPGWRSGLLSRLPRLLPRSLTRLLSGRLNRQVALNRH